MSFKLNSTDNDVLLNKPVDKGKRRKKKSRKNNEKVSQLADPVSFKVDTGESGSTDITKGGSDNVSDGVSEDTKTRVPVGRAVLFFLAPPAIIMLALYIWFGVVCQSFASTDIETVDRSPRFERFVVFCRGQVELRDTFLGKESELVRNSDKTAERKKKVQKSYKSDDDDFDAESVYAGGDIPYNSDNKEHFSSMFERGADDEPIVAETMSDKNLCRLVKVDTGQYKLIVNRANTDFSVVVLSYYTVTINGIDANCSPDDRPMLYIKDTGSAFDISKGTDNNGDYLLLDNTEGTNITNDEAVRVLKTYESMIENINWNF